MNMLQPWKCALLLTAGLCLHAVSAHAHAVRATDAAHGEARVVRFAYSTGETAEYCEVEVYAPGETKVEFQNGRTDARGLFAFVPDKAGAWRVILTDGMGHKLEHVLDIAATPSVPNSQILEVPKTSEISADQTTVPAMLSTDIASSFSGLRSPVQAPNTSTDTLLRALCGVSLLLNVFAGIGLFRIYRLRRQTALLGHSAKDSRHAHQ